MPPHTPCLRCAPPPQMPLSSPIAIRISRFLEAFSSYLNIWYTFSTFGLLSHVLAPFIVLSTFETLSYVLATLLILSQLLAHFLMFWNKFFCYQLSHTF